LEFSVLSDKESIIIKYLSLTHLGGRRTTILIATSDKHRSLHSVNSFPNNKEMQI
jgi:hypothetical protein